MKFPFAVIAILAALAIGRISSDTPSEAVTPPAPVAKVSKTTPADTKLTPATTTQQCRICADCNGRGRKLGVRCRTCGGDGRLCPSDATAKAPAKADQSCGCGCGCDNCKCGVKQQGATSTQRSYRSRRFGFRGWR